MLSLFPIPAPDRNPEDVRSESMEPDTLVIAWEVRICYPNLYAGEKKKQFKTINGFSAFFLFVCLFFWSQEMDKRDFGGPDFKYRVMWRKVVGSGPDWHTDHTREPPFLVSDIQNFSAFEIKVQAVNEIGDGPEPDPVIGYSGEDGRK